MPSTGMSAPRLRESLAGSAVGVEYPDVPQPKFVLHPRALLGGLRPASEQADRGQKGHIRSGQGRTRQNRANPVRDNGPSRGQGRRSRPLDSPPDRLLKLRRGRGIRAPFLKDVAQRLVVVVWFVGGHVAAARAAEARAARNSLLVWNRAATII